MKVQIKIIMIFALLCSMGLANCKGTIEIKVPQDEPGTPEKTGSTTAPVSGGNPAPVTPSNPSISDDDCGGSSVMALGSTADVGCLPTQNDTVVEPVDFAELEVVTDVFGNEIDVEGKTGCLFQDYAGETIKFENDYYDGYYQPAEGDPDTLEFTFTSEGIIASIDGEACEYQVEADDDGYDGAFSVAWGSDICRVHISCGSIADVYMYAYYQSKSWFLGASDDLEGDGFIFSTTLGKANVADSDALSWIAEYKANQSTSTSSSTYSNSSSSGSSTSYSGSSYTDTYSPTELAQDTGVVTSYCSSCFSW